MASTTPLCETPFPYFDTLVHDKSAAPSRWSVDDFHHDSIDIVKPENSADEKLWLDRFAIFVSSVVGESLISFSASLSSDASVRSVLATVDGAKFESQTYPTRCESGFSLHVGTGHPLPSEDNPFVAVLSPAEELHDRVSIAVRLRKDHGPANVAGHLLRLLVSFLSPEESSRVHTESSRLNVPMALSAPFQYAHDKLGWSSVHFLLHELFENNVRKHPHNIVSDHLSVLVGHTVSGNETSRPRRDMTYAEMDAAAERLAEDLTSLLQALDWTPVHNDQVIMPILLPAGPELMMTILAILKSGHAFSILPPEVPGDRLELLMADLGARALLGVTRTASVRENVTWIDVTNPEAWRQQFRLSTVQPVRRQAVKEDLAYVSYTSGTTGMPKGVMIAHQQIVYAISSLAKCIPSKSWGPRLRWMSVTSPSFDVFMLEVFVTLSLGGTLCSAERDLLLTDMEAALSELGGIGVATVPSVLAMMRPESVPTLKYLYAIGELVTPRLIGLFAGSGPDDERLLINSYGPTEASVTMTAQICTVAQRGSVVGTAFSTASAILIDPNSAEPREVPLGMTGELAIAGPQVGMGYLHRPKETAEAFVHSPQYGPMYRTGDKMRVVWDAEGEMRLDFLGRLNTDQVKINGRRTELPEIEAVLVQVDSIKEVAVVAHASSTLVANIVPSEARSDIIDACRAHAAKMLPSWMCPAKYIIHAQLPRNSNSKIDRKLLLKWYVDGHNPVQDPGHSAPLVVEEAVQPTPSLGTTEEPKDSLSVLRHALAKVIGAEILTAPLTTRLSDVRLDSIGNILLLQKLRERNIRNLTLKQLTQAQTLNDLLQLVDTQGKPATLQDPAQSNEATLTGRPEVPSHITEIPVDREDLIDELSTMEKMQHFDHSCRQTCISALGVNSDEIEAVVPSNTIQVWTEYAYLQKELNNQELYTGCTMMENFVYEVPSTLDPARFKQAVRAVFKRFDCFRSVFVEVDHPLAPYAVCTLSPDSELARLREVEVTVDDRVAPGLWEETVASIQLAAERAQRLDKPGYMLGWVSNPQGDKNWLVMTIHHTIYDFATIQLLRDAIAHEYFGSSSSLTPYLGMAHAAFAYLDLPWIDIMTYWMIRFTGIPPGRFGLLRPRFTGPAPVVAKRSRQDTHMRSVSVVSHLSMSEMTEKCLALSLRPTVVFQAAWAYVIAQTHEKHAGLHLQLANVSHGRRTADDFVCMAPMIQTTCVHYKLDETDPSRATNREVLSYLSTRYEEAELHGGIPSPSWDQAKIAFSRTDSSLVIHGFKEVSEKDAYPEVPSFFGPAMKQNAKDQDYGIPVVTEVYPGAGDWNAKMLLKVTWNDRQPEIKHIDEDWARSAGKVFDEAIERILANLDDSYLRGIVN